MKKNSILKIKGGIPLQGKIHVKGAKNFVPKAMVASLLTSEKCVLTNVPDVSDVFITSDLLSIHGVSVKKEYEKITMLPNKIKSPKLSEVVKYASTSRIPILLCGPLLHALGEAFIPNLGGCKIGDRPIDLHLSALGQFGASIKRNKDGIMLTAKKRLSGAKIKLAFPSVGATEQVLLTAVKANGITELTNAAIEPEIIDLIVVLQKMGAIITVETDRRIIIEGVETLSGYEHESIADRNEVASWAVAALVSKGDVFIKGAEQNDLLTFLNYFRKLGGEFSVENDGIRFFYKRPLSSLAVETHVHPGFMTDWQQPFAIALTQAKGISIIHETVYENRFGFVDEVNKMGANIQTYSECLGGSKCRFSLGNYKHSAVISGISKLKATNLTIPDLRGGISYIIAALIADGTSSIKGIDIINRGYEHFDSKLRAIGADFSIK